jgi:hypothetical protein
MAMNMAKKHQRFTNEQLFKREVEAVPGIRDALTIRLNENEVTTVNLLKYFKKIQHSIILSFNEFNKTNRIKAYRLLGKFYMEKMYGRNEQVNKKRIQGVF